jgi:hypothetical protein
MYLILWIVNYDEDSEDICVSHLSDGILYDIHSL